MNDKERNRQGICQRADMFPQFDRTRHGSLWDRGTADSWYRREPDPHWYPEGTYNGERIDNLSETETEEYLAGYYENELIGAHKEY